jgi:hypothetical protein
MTTSTITHAAAAFEPARAPAGIRVIHDERAVVLRWSERSVVISPEPSLRIYSMRTPHPPRLVCLQPSGAILPAGVARHRPTGRTVVVVPHAEP